MAIKCLSELEIQQIAARYDAGERTVLLAKEYGCSEPVILRAVRQMGGKIKPPKSPADKHIPVADALKRYAAGEMLEELARRYGVSRWAVKQRLRANGVEIENRRQTGSSHGMWKGGRHLTVNGYIQAWVSQDDPMISMARGSDRYVFEHRLVMARHLGRPLETHESVHHLNGDRADNRIENLELRQRWHGPGHHAYCTKCGSTEIGYR